jgi:hypothetical protein
MEDGREQEQGLVLVLFPNHNTWLGWTRRRPCSRLASITCDAGVQRLVLVLVSSSVTSSRHAATHLNVAFRFFHRRVQCAVCGARRCVARAGAWRAQVRPHQLPLPPFLPLPLLRQLLLLLGCSTRFSWNSCQSFPTATSSFFHV